MAANSAPESTGRKYYYNIAYGMLCANAKDIPEGYEKIALSEIKSKRQKNENVDLRRKYYDTENGKDYPLRVFYTDIDGIIEGVEKHKYEKGTSLKITIHDSDGDESIIQTDFYGKVAADFLNRLLNVNPENQLNFSPYSIPTSFKPNGLSEEVYFYSSGVSIKDGDTKTERAFNKDNGLPPSERVTNSKGEEETSRVAQINFLWEKVEAKFADLKPQPREAAPSTKENLDKDNSAPQTEAAEEKPKAEASSDTAPKKIDRKNLPF